MIRFPHYLVATAPKCASAWLAQQGPREGIGESVGAQHEPAWTTRARSFQGDRTLIGVVRDPHTFYASLYFHVLDSGATGRLQRVAAGRTTGFREVLYGFTHPETRDWTSASDDEAKHVGLIWPAADRVSAAAAMRPGLGLWSWTMLHIYGTQHAVWSPESPTWAVDQVYDARRSAEAFEILSGTTAGHPGPLHRQVDRAAQKDVRPPVHDYRTLYDDDMLNWVTQADGLLMWHFGLEPFGVANGPVFQQL